MWLPNYDFIRDQELISLGDHGGIMLMIDTRVFTKWRLRETSLAYHVRIPEGDHWGISNCPSLDIDASRDLILDFSTSTSLIN